MAQQAQQQPKPITIQHGLAEATGNVVMLFSEKVDLMILTPEQAVHTALQILEMAKKSKPESVKDISWPPQKLPEPRRG